MSSESEASGSKKSVKFGKVKSKQSSGRKSGVVRESPPTHGLLSGTSQDQPTTYVRREGVRIESDTSRYGQYFDEDEDPFDGLSEQERFDLDEIMIEQQEEEERKEQEAGGPCTPSIRKSVVRACDFCHKQYIAIIYGNLHIESIPRGSAERICDGCTFKPRKKLKGQLKEEIYGHFTRTPGDDDDSSDDIPRPVSNTYDVVADDLQDLALDEEREKNFERKIDAIPRRYESSAQLHRVLDWEVQQTPTPRNFVVPSDEAIPPTLLPPMTDCYTISGGPPRVYEDCAIHEHGDPDCWLSSNYEDFQKEYWDDYLNSRKVSWNHGRYFLMRLKDGQDKNLTMIKEDKVWRKYPRHSRRWKKDIPWTYRDDHLEQLY